VFSGTRRAFGAAVPAWVTVRPMSDVPLNAQDVRAAAEVHSELGPDYGDAVVQSFLERIDKHIEARVDERLAGRKRIRPPMDAARLRTWRGALAGAVAGSVLVGLPLTLIAASALSGTGHIGRLAWIWVVLAAIYGLAAYRLRRR
jgi:hypothetical protein